MGIKAEDLRVGNWLFWGDAVVKVVLIKADGWLAVEYGEDKRFIHVDFCKPIPITEEWLIKLGFKKIGETREYKLGAHKIKNWNRKRFLCFGGNTKCEYVNQLQNLYYALFNKELTLK